MAKITVIGATGAIVSAVKLEDVKTLEKYSPDSLVLKKKGDDDKLKEVFRIGSGTGVGAINKYGANFGSATNAEGFGVITLQIPDDVDDAKEYLADKVGAALMNMSDLEAQIPEAIEAVKAKKAAIMSNITVA